jgi:hypothetical protein
MPARTAAARLEIVVVLPRVVVSARADRGLDIAWRVCYI